MKLQTNLLPKKLNEINYFKKQNQGCKIYSYTLDPAKRNEVLIISLPDTEIEKDFCITSNTIAMVSKLGIDADINITDKSFIVKSKKGKYVATLLSEQLFNLDTNTCVDSVSVDIDYLVKASNFVSKEERRPVLTGVRVDSFNNIYATDSFKAYFKLNEYSFSEKGITLPVNFINLIKNTFNNKNINLYYNNNIVYCEEDNLIIVSRLIDGMYPAIEKVYKNINSAINVEYNKDELLGALEISSNIESASDKDKRIIIELTENHFKTAGADTFDADITFKNENLFTMKINHEMLDQAFKTINKDNIEMKITYNDSLKIGMCFYLVNNADKETILMLGIK